VVAVLASADPALKGYFQQWGIRIGLRVSNRVSYRASIIRRSDGLSWWSRQQVRYVITGPLLIM